jgi:hypothetical protein
MVIRANSLSIPAVCAQYMKTFITVFCYAGKKKLATLGVASLLSDVRALRPPWRSLEGSPAGRAERAAEASWPPAEEGGLPG